MPSFQVTTPNARVNLRADGTVDVPYSVTNVSGGSRRAAFSVKASDDQSKRWYSVKGTPAFEFAPGATQQVTVAVAPPATAAAQEYSFHLIAALADNPDVDFTDGPTVTFVVGPPKRSGIPWWIYAAIAAMVAIIGIVIWLVIPRTVNVPDLKGDTLAAAQAAVGTNLTVQNGNCPVFGPASQYGLVQKQSVAADTAVKPGTTITVCLGFAFIPLPPHPKTKIPQGSMQLHDHVIQLATPAPSP